MDEESGSRLFMLEDNQRKKSNGMLKSRWVTFTMILGIFTLLCTYIVRAEFSFDNSGEERKNNTDEIFQMRELLQNFMSNMSITNQNSQNLTKQNTQDIQDSKSSIQLLERVQHSLFYLSRENHCIVKGIVSGTSEWTLVGGQTQSEGNVHLKGKPIRVCDEHWDDADATVICRTRGYSHGSTANGFKVGQARFYYPYKNIACSGKEYNISQCPFNSSEDCPGNKSAGVKCYRLDQQCSSILLNNQILCSNRYDFLNSQFICKWSGYSTGYPAYLSNQGSNLTFGSYFTLRCKGGAKSIKECGMETSSTCSSGLYAGFSCA